MPPKSGESALARLGRSLLLVAGIIGGFAAVDAFMILAFLLAAGLLIDTPLYVGLLNVLLLVLGMGGAGVAWAAYSILHEPASPAEEPNHVHT